MKVGFRFCRSDGQTRPLEERWGLLDSGASITAVPAFFIGLFGNQYPADLTGPISLRLTGLNGTRPAPGYFAILSVSTQLLDGPFCPACGVRLVGRRCPNCLVTPPAGAFLIAAVQSLSFPLIGRDVADNFLTVIDPLARRNNEKFSMLANGRSGRLLARCLKMLRGTSLSRGGT
jgi:hypothetical protein